MHSRRRGAATVRLLGGGFLTALCALSGITAFSSVQNPPSSLNSDAATFFETKIRPLLVDHCFSCHGDGKAMGGVRLDSRAAMLKGGDHGPVLNPGSPEQSLLLRVVHYDGAVKMPPAGKLSADAIAALTQWVKMGAPWPETKAAENAASASRYVISPEKKNFWSFQPVKNAPLPAVKNRAWVKSPIDAFILADLEKKGLTPAPPAEKRVLIRRATFDLIGLPPTPAEIQAFLQDRSPNAFAKVVDRLLASPRYGERWGRHWLDVVRYVDSLDARGLGGEGDISEAWRYRDWVVDAFNRDMPYNQFVLNQVAGDLLPGPTPGDINIPGTIATGLLAIGNWGNGDADKEKILTDIADDQVDVVSRGFMGLTVACARCHNHKFDPISTQDYYGMAGIFFSTHILPKLAPKGAGETPLRIPLVSKAEIAKREQVMAQTQDLEKRLKAATDGQAGAFARSLLPQTARYLTAVWDYANRPAAQANLSLADFAAQQGLHAYALRQWRDYLGFGDYALLTTPLRDLLGNAGVHVWKGAADTPSLTVNTNDAPRTILTFTLPPRSVAVHPSPNNGVAVGWKSPISGTVRIAGRVADADPACGDGIAWVLDHRTAGGVRELASGDFPNGGAQGFTQGKGAEHLSAVTVKAGDQIQLLVLPKMDYGCDTTVVELTITPTDGARVWDLTRDIVDTPLQGNPHSDRYGNADAWRFYDMADSSRDRRPEGALGEALDRWQRAVANVAAGERDRNAILEAAQEFQQRFTLADDLSPFWIRSRDDEKALPPAAREELAKLSGPLDTLRKNPPPPVSYANGAQEGGCPESPQAGFHDVHVHIRGSYLRLAELVPRHFPVVLAGEAQPPITQGSGRLELARWLVQETHPLTPRVLVNRVWQHHFGEGIVRTPSNFGFLGERPSHPALLDYLAWQFVHSGWSIKKLHRTILLSAAYQQSSNAPAKTLRLDPDNRLFGRMNRRRLEAEAVRDNLLAVSGSLDTTMGGPAVRDFAAPRRTLYIMTIRSDRSGFGPLFDAADSTASVDRRTISTVAPQALFLLNNAFALEQTHRLATRIRNSDAQNDSARIQNAYALLYGRPAADEEVKIGLTFLSHARKTTIAQVAGPGAPDIDRIAWEQYCQILLCANEFLYID